MRYSPMKRLRVVIQFLLSVCLMTSSPAQSAEVASGNSPSTNTSSTPSSSTSSIPSTNTSPANNYPDSAAALGALGGNGASSSDNAAKGSGDQAAGAAVNMGMGVVFITIGAILMGEPPTEPVGMMLTAMGVLALGQGAAQMATSGGNESAADQFRTNGFKLKNNTPNGPNSPTKGSEKPGDPSFAGGPGSGGGMNQYLTADAKKALEKAEALGFKLDSNTGNLTTPDGRVLTPQDAGNTAGMAAKLGLSPEDAKKADLAMAEIMKNKGLEGPTDGALAGGRTAATPTSGATTEGYDGTGGRALNASSRLPSASSVVAGLSTNYRGEPIGVASDDIFQMISRRYRLKDQQDSFISGWAPRGSMMGNHPGN